MIVVMMPQLTPEMRQALADQPGRPLYVQDTVTNAKYVLIPESAFQRVQTLLDGERELDVMEFFPLAHDAFAAVWDAPGMDAYDDYDAHRG
jgi:hypothetical protein